MRLTSILSGFVLLSIACSSATDVPTSSASANVVVDAVALRLADRDSVTITITNAGDRDAFLSRCGAGPLLLTQQLIGELWAGGVQNFMCPVSTAPGQVRLAPGERIELARVFDIAGRYRVLVMVGTNDDLTDASRVYSNGFDVP